MSRLDRLRCPRCTMTFSVVSPEKRYSDIFICPESNCCIKFWARPRGGYTVKTGVSPMWIDSIRKLEAIGDAEA
jgi:hypothetical protein